MGDGVTEGFGGLTANQNARMLSLARRVLAEKGVEVVAEPGVLRAADGREFGLTNLASKCRNNSEEHWPRIIADQLLGLLALPLPLSLADVPREDMLRDACLRLVHLEGMPPEMRAWYGYARPVAAGLAELIVRRQGDTVRFLTDDDVARVGAADLHAAALENLLRVQPGDIAELRSGGASFTSVRGESGFIASKLLVMPSVLQRVFGDREHPDGVLVAVPTRYSLALCPVDGKVIENLGALIEHAAREFDTGACPLAPNVLWWRDGIAQEVNVVANGRMELRPRGEFAEILVRLLEARGAGTGAGSAASGMPAARPARRPARGNGGHGSRSAGKRRSATGPRPR